MDRIGIGPTYTLSLRVSVATLVRFLFRHPADGVWTLVLERKAISKKSEAGRLVEVKAQPFGGALHILDVRGLRELIGDFHYDSEGSRSERDFRLFIQPSSWQGLRKYCIALSDHRWQTLLETDPVRELREELWDALQIDLLPDQFTTRPVGVVIEDHPEPTKNPRATGFATARIYFIFEVILTDDVLGQIILDDSVRRSDQALCDLALREPQDGYKGRANAALAVPLKPFSDYYATLSPKERERPIIFEGHRLDETVAVILEGISVPKYRWY